MGDACASALPLDVGGGAATRISGSFLGAVIVVTCAACVTPIELFLVELWPRLGFSSLLLVVVPLMAGLVVVGLLPESYYRIKRFESSGRLYKTLGIRFFKRFVPNGDYVNRMIRGSEAGYRVVRDERSIVRFEALTRTAEKCHLVSLLLILPSTAYALLLGWYGLALWLLLPNIPLHLYPVLLQRYTRGRIQRLLDRQKAKGPRLESR